MTKQSIARAVFGLTIILGSNFIDNPDIPFWLVGLTTGLCAVAAAVGWDND